MPVRRPPRRALWAGLALALVAAVPVTGALRARSAQAADATAGDGTTSATAGASCWGIKQAHAGSADGIYWLNTAALHRPQQFYCDMTTDGGGWVLVGRGRDGWTFGPQGQGSAATVREAVDGPDAFGPAALDTATVADLLDGTAVSDLPDGIRLERATDAKGSTRQDYRLFPTWRDWTWSLAAGQLLDHVTVDGTTYRGSNTGDTAASTYGQTTNALAGVQGVRRLFTKPWSKHGDRQGFSLGSGVSGGSSSATSYLWTAGSEGSPLPFTRVWVRPRVANDAAGFTPLPADGLDAAPEPAELSSHPEKAPWGVVGVDHTGETRVEPWNANVLALRVAGDRTFVGGRFQGVQQGPGATPVAQPFLAAFDLDGTWIPDFRPHLDGRVFDLAVAPDGNLLVAGDFTAVDGRPGTAGLAELDPRTGQVVDGWRAELAQADGSRPLVRTLDVHGDTIYVGGNFNRVTAGSWNTIKVANAVSLDAATANPRPWRPRLTASAVDLQVTADGSRVLVAGYFDAVDGDRGQGYFAITDAATGNPVPGIGPWAPSVGSKATYQQAVADLGDRVMVGGSEHDTQLWTRDRTALVDSHITKQGGDTQVIETFDGRAYVGCHCGNWIYQGTNDWSSPNGFRSIAAINLVGAIDTETFEYDTGWYPAGLKGAHGEGVWAIDRDERGCLWVGGDLDRGAWSGNAATDWLGGFARFCPADSTPPTPPSGLRASTSGDGATLSWKPATDDGGTVSYDVYRDDRVIATVWGTSYTDPVVDGTHRYTVRAADARGNRSAAPAPINVNGPSPEIATVVPFASTWRYLDDGSDEGAAWRDPGFDDRRWADGPGRLGWGVPDLGTTFAGHPQTAYLRTSFEVADPGAVRLLDLQVAVATGAVVYVNGVEAGRINMPGGAVSAATPAAGYIWGAAEREVHDLAVPADLLRAGTNTLAVELHSMRADAGRAFVDVEATTFGAGGDQVAPQPPGASAAVTPSGVELRWSAATDDTALGGYLIRRDGEPLAVTGPAATGWLDGTADTTVAHTYEVTAFDTAGNAASSGPVRVAGRVRTDLLAYGSTWRWTYPAGGLAAGWAAPGYDDAGWASGAGQFGYGDSDEATVLTTAPAPRPVTAYFRTTVQVDDPTAFASVVADLVRDDGVVVYVNGVEVGRDNLPAGPVAPTTLAATGIADRTAEQTPITLTIPSTAFAAGPNVVAVEVHNADRWSGDLSFDLQLTGRP